MVGFYDIKDFVIGEFYTLRRRFSNPDRADPVRPVLSARLFVGELFTVDGVVVHDGGVSPFIVEVSFPFLDSDTRRLTAGLDYPYRLVLNYTVDESHVVEVGHLNGQSPDNLSSGTAITTYSDAAVNVTDRTRNIIDFYLDAILGDYRQLKVWDEKARRCSYNPLRFQLSYEYVNHYTPVEVYDGFNNRIPDNQVQVDYRNGSLTILTDDGNQDYFVTYTFDFFPSTVLTAFCQLSLLELNYAGVTPGTGYVTNFQSISDAPPGWDGAITAGAAAKAWRKLATTGPLWRNVLIWGGYAGDVSGGAGGNAQAALAAAETAASSWQQMFDSLAQGVKSERYLAPPSVFYQIFRNQGFGGIPLYGSYGYSAIGTGVIGGKFRGLHWNKISLY